VGEDEESSEWRESSAQKAFRLCHQEHFCFVFKKGSEIKLCEITFNSNLQLILVFSSPLFYTDVVQHINFFEHDPINVFNEGYSTTTLFI